MSEEITIRMFRLVGYDKDGLAYDITRVLNLDTEQFINLDLNIAEIDDEDRTKTLSISRQEKKDIKRLSKSEKKEKKEKKVDSSTITDGVAT